MGGERSAEKADTCRDAEHHAEGTGCYDPNGHEITEEWFDDAGEPCSGAGDCLAAVHEHGCYADIDGSDCTDPEDHDV